MNDVFEKIDLNSVDWKSSREFFESLGEALDKLDDKDESYNFTWVGKRKSIIEAGAPINKILRPDMEASRDFDNTKNMLIVGDNLDALKLLQESYLGKIKMIYIDPPYNTGHDFVYHDNFTIKKADFEDGSTDSEGNVIVSEDEYEENSKANGRFHSDWLSMMYPRLKLARNLLTDNGVIFISIDDNEEGNLRKICDEVFGEENLLAIISWQSSDTLRNDATWFSANCEFILCYARNVASAKINGLPKGEKQLSYYKNPDNDPNGPYLLTPLHARSGGPNSRYNYTFSNGQTWCPPDGRYWAFSKESLKKLEEKGAIKLDPDGRNVPQKKTYLKDVGDTMRPWTFWSCEDFGSTRQSNMESRDLLGRGIFDTPKPLTTLEKIITIGTDNDSIVLDFFAGSGTTGHAIMAMNTKDKGERRYILVQLDEKVDEKSEAWKTGYKTINQITTERLRRAGEIIDKKNLGIDTGFRVFKIDSSNEKDDTRKALGEVQQSAIFDLVDNVKPDRSPLDLLFGFIYVSALPFDLKLETRKISNNTVYLYGYLGEGTGLSACFDNEISDETVKEIAKLNTLTAAFKDSSFADSASKINLSEHFRIVSPETKVKVL